MAQERQYCISIELSFRKRSRYSELLLYEEELERIYGKIGSFFFELETFLKKNLGIRLISLSQGVLHCHADDSWDIDRVINQFNSGEATGKLRCFLHGVVFDNSAEQLVIRIKWNTVENPGSNVRETASGFENKTSYGSIQPTSSQKSYAQAVVNPTDHAQNAPSHGSCQDVTPSSKEEQTGANRSVLNTENSCLVRRSETFKAVFWLFIPEEHGHVEKAWLVLCHNGKETPILMMLDDTDGLWIASKEVERCSKYYYKIKHKIKPSGIGIVTNWFKSAPSQTTSDNQPRETLEHHVQKDIFGPPINNRVIAVGYKVFLKRMILNMKTEDDLYCAIDDYNQKHRSIINGCDHHLLASFVINEFTKCREKNFKSFEALFTLYFLSRMYTTSGEILYAPSTVEIKDIQKMTLLINSLKIGKFKPLRQEVAEMVIDTLGAILILHFGHPKCSWLHLLAYSCHFLPSGCLIKRKSTFECKKLSLEDWIQVMRLLLELLDNNGTYDALIEELLKIVRLEKEKIEVLKALTLKLPPESALLKFTREHVLDGVKESLKSGVALNYVNDLVLMIGEADRNLLCLLNNEFEEAILSQLNSKTVDQHQAMDLAFNDALFKNKEQAFKLLQKAAKSQFEEVHSMFPKLAEKQKFMMILNLDIASATSLLESWIETAGKIKTQSFGYDKKWYDYVQQAIEIAGKLQDDEVMHKIEKGVAECLISDARNNISALTSSAQDIRHLADYRQLRGKLEEHVLSAVCQDLEISVLKLVTSRSDWGKKPYRDCLLLLIHSPLFFKDHDSAWKILEALATSRDVDLHSLLLDAMCDKFWELLDLKELQALFKQWISTAKSYCKEKAKMNKSSCGVAVESVLLVYGYLEKFLSMDVPQNYHEIKPDIEIFVKDDFSNLKPNEQMKLIAQADSQIEKVSNLLVNHFGQIQSGTLTESEIKAWLKHHGEAKEIDIRTRAKYTNFMHLLDSLHDYMKTLKSNTHREEFICQFSHFWTNLLACEGFYSAEVKGHEIVVLMMCSVTSFVERTKDLTITLEEFTRFDCILENATNLVVKHFETLFLDHWKKLQSKYDEAKQKLNLLKRLNSSILQKMKKALIADYRAVQRSLQRIEEKLDSSSSCPMGDLDKRGFYMSLYDLIKPAEELEPLLDCKTFISLCRSSMKDIDAHTVTTALSNSCSNLETMGLSELFSDELELCEETEFSAVDVVNYICEVCIEKYRNWLQEITDKEATLTCAKQFGTDQISAEVEKSCKHFRNISVTGYTLKALNMLSYAEEYRQKAANMQKTLEVLDFTYSFCDFYDDLKSFVNCFTAQNSVTLYEFADVVQELDSLFCIQDLDWWTIIDELSKSAKLVGFIKETLDDDFRNLIDAVEEQSEQTIDESTVSSLIQVKQFLQPLLRQNFKNPTEFFGAVTKSMQKGSKDISSKINVCRHNLHGLKAIYQHVANRGELTKEIINNAMTSGKYMWNLKKGDLCCTVELTYGRRDSSYSYKLEELNDFRSRALLLSNSEKREKDQKAKQLKTDLQQFVMAVDRIQEIAFTVTELHQLGHFSYRTYSHKEHSADNFLVKLENVLEKLKENLSEWKTVLDDCRKKYYSLNYVYSDQLSLLHNYLITGNVNSNDSKQIQNILKFVHPGPALKALVKHPLGAGDQDDSGRRQLDLIGKSLDTMMQNTKIERVHFPNKEKFKKQSDDVKAVVKPGTLYIAHLDVASTQTIPTLLSLYSNTTHHFPVSNEVLFCHELISWEEIQLLLNRCIRSNHSELHCICNVEKLPSNLQALLVEELGKLLESNNHKYCLAVICRGAEHHSITDYFASFVNRLSGFDAATVQTCLQETWPNVCLVTSKVPGLGKTEFIKNLSADEGKRMKTVHISGPISREILVTQLQNQKLSSCDLLHLDIGEVEDPNFLDACLFEYIVLGCLCSGTKVVCLPTSRVAIEVANTVQDKLADSLVVLSSFKRVQLKWHDYDRYVVSSEICSPVQIVCNYLNSYYERTLDTKDIVFSGPQSVKPLDPGTCKELLKKCFSSVADLSYSVIEIFVNVFGEQLRKLSNSQFFRVSNLRLMLGDKKPNDVRSKLFKALLDVAQEFASRSVQSCRSVQTIALVETNTLQAKGIEKQTLTQAEFLAKRVEGMLHWADSNHLLVTFNGIDAQTVSALYRDLKDVPDYIKELFKSQLRRELPNFNILSREELQTILERISRSTLQKSKSKVDDSYALTPDNILKMILILLRIRANIPVVIMGETGCGKTSLIRYLANTCDTVFEHFSIHAGITVGMIIERVLKNHDQCLKNPNKQTWLFLDEINTCNHLGLLTEIICHHSCLGKSLAKNLVFIAACNPYRLREDHQIMTAGLEGKVKTDSFSKLVYRVHPLPETMIDYVWDYGTLHRDDEVSYIKQMVNLVFPEAKTEWQLRQKIIDLLVISQDFIRETEKCEWCVSLRDVYRCQMLMTQFLKMLYEKMKHILGEKPPTYLGDDEAVYRCAIVLALAHCYQSRLATTHKRDEYWKKCSNILLGKSSCFEELTEMVRYEQLDLLNRMSVPQGIAKNTALCENVFVILVCILNRIPVFLVGKPGCSKSLSVQLIKSNLRGKDSSDSYFQTLPNLYIVSYQGSESSTSEGIMKVFNKAKKYGDANKDHDVLPVVLLDEVGLAEASRFNPLKVLHGLLEPATGELPSVAVVGISNWALDAAKMNRAIYLSRPDMDIRELHETGRAISGVHSSGKLLESFELNLQVSDGTLKTLADSYFKYQQEQLLIKNFHGLRDYYALIKYVSRLKGEQENNLEEMEEAEIVHRGLLRNFGGTEYGVSDLIKNVQSSLGASPKSPKWPIEEIILDNLEDKLARHLMLITSGDSSLGILISCLNKAKRKYVTIFGSKFEEDQTEDYSYRILSRIILCMEAGSVLILKDLDTIYGSLYDMLNQNYTIVGKKKNCRIALGPNSNPMCQVHDDFRCIVLVEEQKVNYSDPPFLNRFEKQILKFDTIIADEQKKVIKEIETWMDDFCSIDNMAFVKENAFIGLNQDTVSSVVYQIGQDKSQDFDKTFDDCQNALLWLVPPDAILRGIHSEFSFESSDKMKSLQERYFDRPIHQGLSFFLSAVLSREHEDLPPLFNDPTGVKIVVYTHSNIYVDLRKVMKDYQQFQVEKLGSFKSEKQFTQQIRQFFESDNTLFILQCEPREDGKHIPLAKFQLEELHQECARKSEKHICIVLHMERAVNSATSTFNQFSFLSGWQLAVIDSLEQEFQSLTETLSMSISDILKTEFCPLEQCIQKNLVWAFTCTSSSYGERSMEEFLQLVTQISESKDMLSYLSDCILKRISKDEDRINSVDFWNSERWQVKVACDKRLLHSATSFTDALKQHLNYCVTVPLANLVYRLEKLSAWNSYFGNDKAAAKKWQQMFQDSKIFSLDAVEIPQGPGSFKISHKPLNLQCPFSQIFIDKLCKREELFKEDILEAETTASGSEGLSSSKYLGLFEKYNELFENDVSLMANYELMPVFEQGFINDICNCLSLGYTLDENERIEVALWLIKIKAHPHKQQTPSISITESLLCLWQNQPLLHALLQLISECQPILPFGVKEMLVKISDNKQLKVDIQSSGSIDDIHLFGNSDELNPWSSKFLSEMANEHLTDIEDENLLPQNSSTVKAEVDEEQQMFIANFERNEDEVLPFSTAKEQDSEEMSLYSLSNEALENMDEFDALHSKEDFNQDSEVNIGLSADVDDDCNKFQEHCSSDQENVDEKESEPEGSKYDESEDQEINIKEEEEPDIGAENDLSNEASEGSENEQITEETLEPEEQLVHLLCKLLIPSAKVLEECKDIAGWHGRVCSVLSFCSSVSSYPVSFHALRIFNDLATVLFHCKLDGNKICDNLLRLSEVIDIESLEKSLISDELFDRVTELYEKSLEFDGVSETEFECFVCMYIGRLIDVDSENTLFGRFLIKAAKSELLDKSLSQIEMLMHRMLLEVEATYDGSLFDLFKTVFEDGGEDAIALPQLAAIDDALQQVDMEHPHFLILCIDVIQDRVMKNFDWENLDDVSSAADNLLLMLKKAINITRSSEKGSLSLAVSVSFIKEFLHHLSEIILYDFKHQEHEEHKVLYQNVNALLNDDCWHYLLRKLKFGKTHNGLKKLIASMEASMPNIMQSEAPNDELSLALGYKILGNSIERNSDLETALLQLKSDEKLVTDFLKNSDDEKQLLALTEALLHAAFIANGIRALNMSEKYIGTWFKDKDKVNQLPNKFIIALVQRITNVESFGKSLLQLTPDMEYRQLQQTGFLLHLISIVAIKQSAKSNNLLTKCLLQTNTVFKWSQNPVVKKSSMTKIIGRFLVTCKCWFRVICSGKCQFCPVCNCDWNSTGLHAEEFVDQDLLSSVDTVFEIKAVAAEVLKLFIDAILLCSFSIGTIKEEDINADFEIVDCEGLIANGFEKRWALLQESLQLDAEDLSLLLKSIVDRFEVFDGTFDLENPEDLGKQLDEVEKKLIVRFLRTSLCIDIKLYHNGISIIDHKIRQNFQEFPTDDYTKLLTPKTCLFRQNRKRTFANMRAVYYINEKERDHPVIDMFFKKGHHLSLIQYLMPLIKWSLLCHQVVNHRFTREDCRKLTLHKLITETPKMKETLKKSYDRFADSLEKLSREENFAVLRAHDGSLPCQIQAEQIMVCENSDSVLYKIMKILVRIQNKFLTELLFIAQSGKCPSLGFLKKNFNNMAAIKAVLLQNLKEDEVIMCEFESVENDLIKYAQNSLIFGLGNQAAYNFVKIEMELANMLSLGKAYVVMNQTFPFVSYANEMFVACASVLREFKTIVSQKPIGTSVTDGITKKMENNRDFINQMMRQIEILLSLAKKTGGNPDQTLRNYTQAWLKTLPGGFAEENLTFEGEPLCLCHLVGLYEFLESLQADAAIMSMNQLFRAPLPPVVEKDLRDFADMNHIELASIQVAFKRFVMRHLVNFDEEKMDLDTPLIQWMAEPSLWPKGVQENGELDINKEGGKPKTIRSEFPQTLSLEHTFHVLTCINKMIEDRTKLRAKWLQDRTPATASPANNPAKSKQGRQRTKAKMGKT